MDRNAVPTSGARSGRTEGAVRGGAGKTTTLERIDAVTDRSAGIYRSYKIIAVPRAAIVFIPVAALFIHEAIVTLLIGILSVLAFKAPLPADLLRFALAWIASMGAMSALGWTIGTIARTDRAAILISQVFFIPSIMLGSLMMPASILPKGLTAASLAFPATYSMRAFGSEGPFLISIGVLAGVCLCGFLISVLCFRWENALKKTGGVLL